MPLQVSFVLFFSQIDEDDINENTYLAEAWNHVDFTHVRYIYTVRNAAGSLSLFLSLSPSLSFSLSLALSISFSLSVGGCGSVGVGVFEMR